MSSKNVVDLRKGGRRRPQAAPRVPASRPLPAQKGRTSPLREKRRRIRLITLAVCAVLAVIGVFALSYVSYLPRYTISSYTIDGAQTIPTKLVAQYIETQLDTGTRSFFSPNNIFLYPLNTLGSNIVGFFPRIKSAKVSRASLLATAITVTIQERQEFALWCEALPIQGRSTASGCYRMDDTGFIFAPATTVPVVDSANTLNSTSTEMSSISDVSLSAGEKIFSGGLSTSTSPVGRRFAPGHLPGILALFDQLGHIGLTPMGTAVDENGNDFTIPLREGFVVKASFGQDADGLVRNLQLILSSDALQGKQSDLDYIDLRFGDRTYYKLKGIDTTSPAKH